MASSPQCIVPPTLLRPPSYHPALELPASNGKMQYVIINPMHIINLHDKTRTFGVRVVEKIKAISERWFTHVLLLLFLFIYAALGALIFQSVEGGLEEREKMSIIRTRELIVQHLWEARNLSNAQWTKVAYRRLYDYEGQLEQHLASQTAADSEKTAWTFWGSMFYCGTIFTTIGYGNIVPATTAGRAITIIYAFIGIPFLLMVLADLGKLFTRAIKAIFYYVKLFYHTGKCRRARRMGRRATAVPAQYMSVALNKMPYMVYQGKRSPAETFPATPEKDIESHSIKSPTSESSNKSDKDVKKKDKDKKVKDKDEKVKNKDEKGEKVDKDAENEEEIEDHAIQTEEDIDDEFNLPISLAVLMLIAYMMLGAFVFTLWEEWSFFESFYFVFISMSTIGFGDYVPDHPMYMMGAFIYLLFGLALTSMCINVVQEKLSATFEMAKLRIGTTIGLDANILMEEDILPEKPEGIDGRRRSSTVKSRRGSKVVPQTSPTQDDADENKNDETQAKENGLKVDRLSP